MAEQRISRRNFVAAAAARAASALAGERLRAQDELLEHPGSHAIPQADEGLKLGVASYSLRNFPRQQAIEMTRSLGVRYINFKSVHLAYDASPTEFATARAELAAAGLELVGGGMITFETDTDEGVRKYFDYAKTAGMAVIVCTCKADVLPRIEKFVKQYDIKIASTNTAPKDRTFR